MNMLVHKYVKHYFKVPCLHWPISLKTQSDGLESPQLRLFFSKSVKEEMT